MGNAEPADSPAAENPDGEVVEFEAIDDIDATVTASGEEPVLAVRAGGTLFTGALESISKGEGEEISISPEAADVSANAGRFAVVRAGDNEVDLITPGDGDATAIPVDEKVTVAAPLSSGGVIAGSNETERVWVYDQEGNEQDTFKVARPSDFIVAAAAAASDPDSEEAADRVVRVNRFDTTIQDLQVDNARQGGTLRVGLGVGKVAFGEDGLVLAADATGDQLFVYTTDEVIRLHQTVPTDPSPWDVAWDPARKLAWITSTEANTVTGYDISQGVPVEKLKYNTVASPQSLIALDDGTLVIGSATGDGLQIIAPDEEETETQEDGNEGQGEQ